jgi:hypothetical protein
VSPNLGSDASRGGIGSGLRLIKKQPIPNNTNPPSTPPTIPPIAACVNLVFDGDDRVEIDDEVEIDDGVEIDDCVTEEGEVVLFLWFI